MPATGKRTRGETAEPEAGKAAKKTSKTKATTESKKGALEVGDKCPLFEVKDQDGNEVSTDTLKGRYAAIYFYPKDNTPGCTKESCTFRDLTPEFEELNCSIYGASLDHATSHGKFIAKYSLTFPLLVADQEMLKAFKAAKAGGKIQRSTVLIDPEGGVVGVWNPVKGAEKHPNEVLELLKSQE
ncbi:unnamed protein product [Chrysoparadoxa australica]